MKKKQLDFDLTNINEQLMPHVNSIEEKMNKLKEKYNVNVNFDFKEITMDEILKNT